MTMWTRNVLSYDPQILASSFNASRTLANARNNVNPDYLSSRYKWFLQTLSIAESILPPIQCRIFMLYYVFNRNGTEIGIILGSIRTDGRLNLRGTPDINRRNCLRQLSLAVSKIKRFYKKYNVPGPFVTEIYLEEEEEKDDIQQLIEDDVKRNDILSILAYKNRIRYTWDRGHGYGSSYDYS